jgi:hypothetical protein
MSCCSSVCQVGQHKYLKHSQRGLWTLKEQFVCVCVSVCVFLCALEHPDSLVVHTATGDHTGAIWEKTLNAHTKSCTHTVAHATVCTHTHTDVHVNV